MPISQAYSFSSRSPELFSPGRHHPRIRVALRPVATLKAAAPYGERGPELGVTKLDSDRFTFPSGYWHARADSTLELGSRCRHTRTTDS